MNSSPIHADRGTHVRMAIVTLLASTLVVWIGISARVTSTTWPAAPQLEAPAPHKIAAPVQTALRTAAMRNNKFFAATDNATALDANQSRPDMGSL